MSAHVRRFKWFQKKDDSVVLASGNQDGNNNLLADMSDLERKDATITRVILRIHVRPDTVAQFTNTSYGLTLVNADAAGAGVFPEADDDNDRVDWLLRDRTAQVSANLSDMTQQWHAMYDLRAQRVIRSAESSLFLIFDHGSGGGVVAAWYSRVLVKLA